MSVDADEAIASPRDCLDGILDVLIRLVRDFGLSLSFEALGPDTAGTFSGHNRRAVINSDLLLDEQLVQLTKVWTYLAVGPHATPDARHHSHLHAVPD